MGRNGKFPFKSGFRLSHSTVMKCIGCQEEVSYESHQRRDADLRLQNSGREHLGGPLLERLIVVTNV